VDAAPALSVVVPFFNEEDNIDALFGRLLPSLRALGRPFEVVCVDDGSRDRTLEMLLAARRANPEIVVKSFARNFGQHAAVTAGLAAARGAFVVTLDADLQNPPEEVAKLVAEFDAGHDYVGTIRMHRDDSGFRKFASKIVGGTTRKMSGLPIKDFGCMLRGYSREIAHEIAARHETRTFIPALGFLFSKSPVEIEVKHEARHEGQSKYSFLNLIRLNFDLMSGFSVAPLRLLFTAGLFVGFVGFVLFAYIVVERIVHSDDPDKWTQGGVFTLFGILFLFVGAQFVAFGLLGEYIGRILQTVRRRPSYVLRELDKEPRA
jgi:undecaprenyl-phosphate 4-deoxy-4-formamido-L-arabinose transferase